LRSRQLRSAYQRLLVLGFGERLALGQLHQLLTEELQLLVRVIEIELDHVGERADRHAGARRQVRVQVALELEDQHDDLGLVGVELVERRNLDIDEHRAGVAHDIQRILEDRIGLRRHAEELATDADARAAQTVRIDELPVVAEEMSRARSCLRIARIRAGECAEHCGCISERAPVRAHCVLRV
jgi:hypothetical protein